MTKLQQILASPEAMAAITQRACGNLGIPLGPHVAMPGVKEKYPDVQTRNTEAATQAQQTHAAGRGEVRP